MNVDLRGQPKKQTRCDPLTLLQLYVHGALLICSSIADGKKFANPGQVELLLKNFGIHKCCNAACQSIRSIPLSLECFPWATPQFSERVNSPWVLLCRNGVVWPILGLCAHVLWHYTEAKYLDSKAGLPPVLWDKEPLFPLNFYIKIHGFYMDLLYSCVYRALLLLWSQSQMSAFLVLCYIIQWLLWDLYIFNHSLSTVSRNHSA